jgi:hypothetical protein
MVIAPRARLLGIAARKHTMSLIEIIGESLDPGPVGDFHGDEGPRPARPRAMVVLRGAIGLAMIAAPLVIAALRVPFSLGTLGFVALGLAVYLLLAYRMRPNPDFSNMGYLGGVLDDPFRYSDDLNRLLLFLKLLLWPGRFATTSVLELFREPPALHE